MTESTLPGILSGAAGQTWALVSAPFRQRGAAAAKAAAANRRPSGSAGATGAQQRGGAGATQLGANTPWWKSLTRRFALNGLLWCLAFTTIVASGIFYREHLRYADGQRVDQASIDLPGEVPGESADIKTGATAEVRATPAEETPTEATATAGATAASVASPLLSSLGLAGAAKPAGSAAPDTAASASTAQVNSLRSEVVALRELVERHDKMLRYVMDRYVEKAVAGSAIGVGSRSSAAHEVTPEIPGKSDYDVPAVPPAMRAGTADRKRRGGGDALPMGQPEMESSDQPSSLGISELQIQASTTRQGAVGAAVPAAPAERSSVRDSEPSQLQLGI